MKNNKEELGTTGKILDHGNTGKKELDGKIFVTGHSSRVIDGGLYIITHLSNGETIPPLEDLPEEKNPKTTKIRVGAFSLLDPNYDDKESK